MVSSGSDEAFPENHRGFIRESARKKRPYHSDNEDHVFEDQQAERTSDTIRQYAQRARRTSSYSFEQSIDGQNNKAELEE